MEPPESKEMSNNSLVDASKKDTTEEMKIDDIDCIKFEPHRIKSKDNKMD